MKIDKSLYIFHRMLEYLEDDNFCDKFGITKHERRLDRFFDLKYKVLEFWDRKQICDFLYPAFGMQTWTAYKSLFLNV